MKTVFKIVGYNRNTQAWETVAINSAAPAKLQYNGIGVYRETDCATKFAEKLLKGFSREQLETYEILTLKVDGVDIACKNNVFGKWQFRKNGGFY